jgi:hypothetical protein
VRRCVQKCRQTLQVAQPKELESRPWVPHQAALDELLVLRRQVQLRVWPQQVLLSLLDER